MCNRCDVQLTVKHIMGNCPKFLATCKNYCNNPSVISMLKEAVDFSNNKFMRYLQEIDLVNKISKKFCNTSSILTLAFIGYPLSLFLLSPLSSPRRWGWEEALRLCPPLFFFFLRFNSLLLINSYPTVTDFAKNAFCF